MDDRSLRVVTPDMLGRTCSACRWWRESDDSELSGVRPGWRLCALTELDLSPVHLETRAYALDQGKDYARLITAPDFACSQWVAKEDGGG